MRNPMRGKAVRDQLLKNQFSIFVSYIRYSRHCHLRLRRFCPTSHTPTELWTFVQVRQSKFHLSNSFSPENLLTR